MITLHDTHVLNRQFKATPEAVFAAFEDPKARAIWSPPTPEINLAFKEADFREGGRDLCICGPGPAEGVAVETFYHSIARPSRIVFTETISDPSQMAGASLVTVEISPDGGGAALKLTLQIVSLGEENMVDEVFGGWTASLGNLERYLADG